MPTHDAEGVYLPGTMKEQMSQQSRSHVHSQRVSMQRQQLSVVSRRSHVARSGKQTQTRPSCSYATNGTPHASSPKLAVATWGHSGRYSRLSVVVVGVNIDVVQVQLVQLADDFLQGIEVLVRHAIDSTGRGVHSGHGWVGEVQQACVACGWLDLVGVGCIQGGVAAGRHTACQQIAAR